VRGKKIAFRAEDLPLALELPDWDLITSYPLDRLPATATRCDGQGCVALAVRWSSGREGRLFDQDFPT
jgi:hypothetical protein